MTVINIDKRTPLRFMVLLRILSGSSLPIRSARRPPVAGASTGFDCTVDGIARNAASVLGSTGSERNFISVHLSIGNGRGVTAGLERTGELLEGLRQRQVSLP